MRDEIAYTWRNAQVLWAEVPIDGAAAREMLPPGLDLSEPPTATVFVADYPFTTFGSVYREAAVLLHGVDERGPFVHCPWMAVDDDTALILGREFLGFPKKMAEIDLQISGDHAVGTVTRKGVELIRIDAVVDAPDGAPPALFDRRFVNLFGSILTGMSLIEISPSGERFHACRLGDGKVQLATNGHDVLGELATTVGTTVRLATVDFAAAGDGFVPTVMRPVNDPEWEQARFYARML